MMIYRRRTRKFSNWYLRARKIQSETSRAATGNMILLNTYSTTLGETSGSRVGTIQYKTRKLVR